MEAERESCAKLLELFRIAKNVESSDVQNLKVHTSQNYALGPVYAIDYKNKHYYVVDDYSLSDNPKYVEDILLDINHLLKGNILENPTPQAYGTKYAAGLNGVEYYLWESPLL